MSVLAMGKVKQNVEGIYGTGYCLIGVNCGITFLLYFVTFNENI